jgi:two-component system sensor histidine kinase MprB
VSLRTRIAAVASLSVAIAVLAAAIGAYLAVRADLRGQVDSALRARAVAFAAPGGGGAAAGREPPPPAGAERGVGAAAGNLPPPPPPGGPDTDHDGDGFPHSVQPRPFGAAPGYVQFISPRGAVSVPGGQGSSARIATTALDRRIAAAGKGSALSDRSAGATRLRVLTLGAGPRGAVLVALPLSEVDHELGRLELLLGAIGLAGIVLAAAFGMLVARAALAPIARFTQRAERLAGGGGRTAPDAGEVAGLPDGDGGQQAGGGAPAGAPALAPALDLSQRLEVSGRDELARLARSFNATLDALARSLDAQRQLVADAGHELRTPIASLRANIQVLGDAERLPPAELENLRRDIVQELDELTALVGDVVELARGAERAPVRDDVSLDALVRSAVERTRRRAGTVSFALDLQPVLVSADAQSVDRAVSNLLENARRWSPPDSIVEVALRDDGELRVRDHGPGFDERDLAHVFDRFYRAARARGQPGSGLGLAIVRQAADSHGGYAHAENALGGGALLRVQFGAPVAQETPLAADH